MLDSRPFLKEPSNIHDGSRYFSTTFLEGKTGWITLRNTSSTGCIDRGHPLKGGLLRFNSDDPRTSREKLLC